ncbi:tripartite motif-containing protein 16 isoform X2 [Danio rerio]
MVKKVKKTNLQTACPAHAHAEPGDVECDVCPGRKYKAVKSCVECLNSYCRSHLEQHENLFKDRRHNLLDPTRQLHEMICPKHDKPLEIYCRTDLQCICYRCLMDEHKNHEAVTAEAERTEKQKLLGRIQTKFKQAIEARQKELQELRDAVKSYKCSAQTAVDDSERIFTELIHTIERSRSEVTRLIQDQEKAAVSEVEKLSEQLEEEIDDLRRRDSKLEQLSHIENHIHFLQMFQYISEHPKSTDTCGITVSSLIPFHDVVKSISKLKEKEGFCKEELEKFSDRVTCNDMTPISESVHTREQFVKSSCQLTLDSKTVNRYLRLSEGNKAVSFTETPQQYRAHPERFDGSFQVLCRQSVSERCYWEVEWSGINGVCISVSYKSISRKALFNEDMFGFNSQSWGLYCSPSNYLFMHNKSKTKIPVSSTSSRVGVYVDHRSGTLHFYSVSETMALIHTIQTTFTQPLYPGFGLNIGSNVKLCHLTT